MHLRSNSFTPYAFLDSRFAFGKHHPEDHFAFGDNHNPHLEWSGVPEGTRSFALICWDPDVPTVGDDVNQADRTVPLDLPRADFFHWVVADLPAELREIEAGAHSGGITPRGKEPGPTPSGGRSGRNDYTGWFKGDAEMGGTYGGYDGPCPPWNDERIHGYRFAVYALDVPRLELEEGFSGQDLRRAMQGHILDEAMILALYAIHPRAGS